MYIFATPWRQGFKSRDYLFYKGHTMALEQVIEELNENIKTLIEVLQSAGSAVGGGDGLTEAEDPPAKAGKSSKGKGKAKPEPEDEITLDDLRAIGKEVIDAGGKDDLSKLFKKFKVAKLGDAKDSDYPAIKEALEALREKHSGEAGGDDDLL